jgi:carboxymethylenebutenolidase
MNEMSPMGAKVRHKASDFPQELLDLFHEYQHGYISRRDFLDGAKKFAVGGLTATALFEMLRPNYALAITIQPTDPRIKTERPTVPSPMGNGSIKGLYARPAGDAKVPVVLVIHENRGLNPYIEDVARRLAVAGFGAFAPDGLTSVGGYPGAGSTTTTDDVESKAAMLFSSVNSMKMMEDFVASAQYLKARPDSTGKLGAIGFCYGGGVVNQLAVRLGADLSAAVPYYGAQPTAADVAKIKAPINAMYGEADTRTTGGWDAFDKALTAAGVPHEGHIYKAAQHGFHNDTTPRYDEAAAKDSQDRAIAWFNKYLKATA